MGYDIRFGAVHFDDVNAHASGYYAAAGESAKRLSASKCGDLATDTVWLTNLAYETMRSSGMFPHAKYRRHDFLGESCKGILNRLGIFHLNDAVCAQQGVEYLSRIFERVMGYAAVYAGFDNVPMYNLRSGFREKFGRVDSLVSADVAAAIRESENYFVSVERAAGSQAMWMPLYLAPYEHCMQILSQPIPQYDTEWKKIAPSKLPKNSAEIKDWEYSQKVGLAKVSLSNFLPTTGEIINFGSNPFRNQRRWVPFNELMVLNEFCEAKVESALVADKTIIPTEYYEIVQKLNEKQRLSLSGMIFLQNLWSAPGQRYTGGLKGPLLKNVASPFLRSFDRLLCMLAAFKVQELGLEVVGYSACKVYVNCADVTAKKILSVCRASGLLPPLCELDDNEDDETFDVHNMLSIHQTLWGRGKLQQILLFDQKCYEELVYKGAI